MRAAVEGTRNHQLNTSAFKLGQRVPSGVLSEQLVWESLLSAAMDAGLPHSEASRTLRSGLSSGIENPRDVPVRGGPQVNVSEVSAADLLGATGVAEGQVQDASHYIGREGLRAWTLLQDVERVGPLAAGIDGKVWAYLDGVWVPGNRELRKRVVDLLGERYRRAHAETVESMVLARVPFITDQPEVQYLNLTNGLLDWRTGRLYAHSPDIASTTRLPVAWTPGATCPSIDAFLADVVGGDCVALLTEIAGYAVYADQPMHTAVMLDGTGRNGKGLYLQLLTGLVGQDNIAAVPPQRLDTDKFAVAQLYGKLANLIGDVDPRHFKETAVFKQATGQDLLHGEHKYASPFTFRSRALVVAAFNAMPRSSDTTEGFFSRWTVVPFPYQFVDPDDDGNVPNGCKRKDPELVGKLTTPAEMEGFLVRAVEGLRRVMEQGHLSRPESVVQAEAHFRRHADPVRGFLAETMIADHTGWIARSILHNDFKLWAEDSGLGALAAKGFAEKVRSVHIEIFGYPSSESKRNGTRGWAGIRRQTEDERDD